MKNKYYTKKELLESKKLLNEDGWETALMIAGFIPVIGEIADIILIIRYIRRKEYLYAFLMLIALVPTVGDFIAKPLIATLKGAGAAGKLALKNTDELVKFAKANPKFAEKYVQIGKYVNTPIVNKSINQIEKVPFVGSNAASSLRRAAAEHLSVVNRLKPVQIAKQVRTNISKKGAPGFGDMLLGRGPVATGVKDYFRGEKLAAYVARNGQAPGNFISRWWNITLPARRSRRNYVRQFIIANGILDYFGLPSFDAFQRKIETDEKFREEFANHPKAGELVNNTTSQGEMRQLTGNEKKEENNAGMSKLEGMIGLNILKRIAQNY